MPRVVNKRRGCLSLFLFFFEMLLKIHGEISTGNEWQGLIMHRVNGLAVFTCLGEATCCCRSRSRLNNQTNVSSTPFLWDPWNSGGSGTREDLPKGRHPQKCCPDLWESSTSTSVNARNVSCSPLIPATLPAEFRGEKNPRFLHCLLEQTLPGGRGASPASR